MNPRTMMRGSLSGAVALLSFGVAWSLLVAESSSDRADESSKTAKQALTKVSDLESVVKANQEALENANQKLIALGKAPEPVPSTPVSTPVPAGLTASQLQAVRAVVVEELGGYTIPQAAINQISRAAGKLAQDNLQVGLPAAVKAAVGAYCVDDKCRGPRGEKGLRGDPGLRGADAPAVTDEQLLASATQALAAYCGGDTKPCKGEQGVGVKEITCRDSDLMWVYEMTDGSFQYVRGPCRVVEEAK